MHQTRYLVAAIVLLGLTVHPSAWAAKTIYRCEKGGQITLSDMPCDGSTAAEASGGTTIASSSNPSTVGIWNGQLQYSGNDAGVMITAAHAVVPLTLEFTADGKVTGASRTMDAVGWGCGRKGGKAWNG